MAISPFQTTATDSAQRQRLGWLDGLRGMALVAMTSFHFTWDLEFFGYVRRGMTSEFGWRWYAHGIAFTFLVIVGVSMVLAHANGIRWKAFSTRFVQLIAASAAISLATWLATPDRFVFFGILHQITLASLIALAFVRLPASVALAAALTVLFLPQLFRSQVFDWMPFWWIGLGVTPPPSNDYVPVFPWTGAVLLGVAFGKWLLLASRKKPAAPVASKDGPARALVFLGRHSLAYYLVHQPVLFGMVYLAAQVLPPDRSGEFVQSCAASCLPSGSQQFCEKFCACVKLDLQSKGLFEGLLAGRISAQDKPVQDSALTCTSSAAGD